jgi:DNA-binding IclR family transcriptional regulator
VADISNPTSRVLDVLNFLAAHPIEAFTLAEIARHLGLSNGSAHRILTTMTEAHFLSRHPKHKTFTLGMAPVAIGEAALGKHRGLEIARREIGRLAVELNVQCTVNAVVEDYVLLLAKEGRPQTHDGLHRVGERWPIIPPVGLDLIAWSSEPEINAYLAKASAHLSESMQSHLLAALSIIRRRRYSIVAVGPALRRWRPTANLSIGRFRDSAYWSSIYALIGELSAAEIQLLDLSDASEIGIGYISAPVFSPAGTVSFNLTMSGMPNNLGAKKIEEYVEKLCAAAVVVTSETYGRLPNH